MILIGMLDTPYSRTMAIPLKASGISFWEKAASAVATFERFRVSNPVANDLRRRLMACCMKSLSLILALILSCAALAQSPSPIVTQEITQLFLALQNSDCEFFRNGSWHNAERSARHLQRKYDHLLKKGLITTTESFIDLAATESSMSGKPYLVRCSESEVVPSKIWFTGKLDELRQ